MERKGRASKPAKPPAAPAGDQGPAAGEGGATGAPAPRDHPQIFAEDFVCLASDETVLGVVERTAWDDSDDDTDSDSDEEEPLPAGHVEVRWFVPHQPVVPAPALLVLDRSFLHGDVVARAAQPQGQMGSVLGLQLLLDLAVFDLGSEQGVEELQAVPGVQCRALHPFREDVTVLYQGWLGVVEQCYLDVYVRFGSGALGLVREATHALLRPAASDDEPDEEDAEYFLNERVFVTKPGAQAMTWVSSNTVSFAAKRSRYGRVVEARPARLTVNWLTSPFCTPRPESAVTEVEAVRVLDVFPEAFHMVGDTVAVPGTLPPSRCAQIRRIRTLLDVQWQDGAESAALPAVQLVPVHAQVLEHDFWPEDFVVRRSLLAQPAPDLPSAPGPPDEQVAVVRRVNAAECTCTVQWLGRAAPSQPQGEAAEGGGRAGGAGAGPEEEQLPIYELREHPDYRYRVASHVMRLPPPDLPDPPPAQVMAAGAWAGQVLALRHGRAEVQWGDGTRSVVAPSDVLLVDVDELIDGQAEEDEGEEEEEEEEDTDDEEEEEEEETVAEDQGEGADGQAAGHESEAELPPPAVPSPGAAAAAPAGGGFELLPAPPPTHHFASSAVRRLLILLLLQPSSFLLTVRQAPSGVDMAVWSRRVLREWAALRQHLPAGIFVRAFEARTDLLSVLIVGPRGTPYYDCCFLFDIQLPASFPAEPPVVFYRSPVAHKFNPNLYETGRVCLSLLGTWGGRGSECWEPARSTVLQLLVSIQGLVLVPDPYFLEAGYEPQRGTAAGAKAARLYNEHALLTALAATAIHARHPPAPFAELISDHFRARGPAIVARCTRFLEMRRGAAPISDKDKGGTAEPAGLGDAGAVLQAECAVGQPPSQGFVQVLAGELPALTAALLPSPSAALAAAPPPTPPAGP